MAVQKDWPLYFRHHGVRHLRDHLDDWTLKIPRKDREKHEQYALEFLSHWKELCRHLWNWSAEIAAEEKEFQVLFHCFGGINRSAGALCAWLIVAYSFSVDDALRLLLEKRPAL